MEAAAQPGVSIAPAKNTPSTLSVRLMGPMGMLKGATTAMKAVHRPARARFFTFVPEAAFTALTPLFFS